MQCLKSVAERLTAKKQLIRLRPRESQAERTAQQRRPGADDDALLPDDELLLTVGIFKFPQGKGPLTVLQAGILPSLHVSFTDTCMQTGCPMARTTMLSWKDIHRLCFNLPACTVRCTVVSPMTHLARRERHGM